MVASNPYTILVQNYVTRRQGFIAKFTKGYLLDKFKKTFMNTIIGDSFQPKSEMQDKAMRDHMLHELRGAVYCETTMLRWMQVYGRELDEALQPALEYYMLVVQAHLQKLGNIFGLLDTQGGMVQDHVFDIVLESYQDTEESAPGRLRSITVQIVLRKAIAYKIGFYNSLIFYADLIGQPWPGSIVRRMKEEEMRHLTIFPGVV
jgi:ferritin-like metal-binding protein YciE